MECKASWFQDTRSFLTLRTFLSFRHTHLKSYDSYSSNFPSISITYLYWISGKKNKNKVCCSKLCEKVLSTTCWQFPFVPIPVMRCVYMMPTSFYLLFWTCKQSGWCLAGWCQPGLWWFKANLSGSLWTWQTRGLEQYQKVFFFVKILWKPRLHGKKSNKNGEVHD